MPTGQYTRKPYVRPIISPIGPSIAYVYLSEGVFSLIDREDSAWAQQWNWYAFKGKIGYGFRAARNAGYGRGRKYISMMHAELLGISGSKITADHINTNPLDNRRANLRPANSTQQSCNQKISSRNSSGHKGVTWSKVAGKWLAQIQFEKSYHYLGLFEDIEMAASAYKQAAIKLHGEFARLR